MSEFAYDVSLEQFNAQVIQPSMEVPVLVDFWAPWCGPCKTLMPMLEKLADEYQGRFLLARVNSDDYPEIAQHFGVRSVPTVKAIVGGRIVDEFTGARPETELRAFIDRLLPSPAASLRDEAAALAPAGRAEDALALLAEATHANPRDEAARLDAAELLIELGRNEEAEPLLAADYENEVGRAQALRTRLELTRANTDTEEYEARLRVDPDDHAARLELSKALAAAGRYREALEAALEVVRRDRVFDDHAGRKAMLQIFQALSDNERYDDLVREYRRALSAALN